LQGVANFASEYLNIMVYQIDPDAREAALKKEVDLKKLPQYKFYKNDITGDKKRRTAYALSMSKKLNIEVDEDH